MKFRPSQTGNEEFQLDFDLMMDRKRKEKRRYRKRKDIALINDNDDAIARLIADMRQAARFKIIMQWSPGIRATWGPRS